MIEHVLKNSLLPEDENFLLNLQDKVIIGVIFAKTLLSETDFKGISLVNVRFHKESVLPFTHDLFKDLKEIKNTNIPEKNMEVLHYYNLTPDILYEIENQEDISIYQRFIIKQMNKL